MISGTAIIVKCRELRNYLKLEFEFAANLRRVCDQLPACIENLKKQSDDVAFIFCLFLFDFRLFFFGQNQEFDEAGYLNVFHFTVTCT